MSTTTKENHESGTHTDMQSMGRRRLLQALAATGSVAVLGGLKLDLNWEAPFVEISQIAAQAASCRTASGLPCTPYTNLGNQTKADQREAALKAADPVQGGKRTSLPISVATGDSPHVSLVGRRTTDGRLIARYDVAGFIANGALFYLEATANGGKVSLSLTAEPGYAFIEGQETSWTDVTTGSTFIVTVKPTSGTGNSYEVEFAIGSDATVVGADNGNNVIAATGLVAIAP